MADENIFAKTPEGETEQEEINVSVEDLVGEGKKYADENELAKAYANADGYIQKLKAEKARIEAEAKVLRDLAENKEDRSKDSDSRNKPPVNAGDPKDDKEDSQNKTDLSQKIAEELEKLDKTKAFTNNVNEVSERLSNFYGGSKEAQKAINAKAKEMKVDVDWLMDIAGRSPTAFYNTVGIDQRSLSTPNANTGGNVNTSALDKNTGRRNFKYYEEMRKTSPKQYYSPAVQKELYKDARELGEKFYQ